jgi:hypothetical protein
MSDDDVIDVRGVVMAAMSSRCSGAGGGGWAEAVGGLAVSIFGNNLLLQPLFILRGLLFNCIKLYDVCIRYGLSEHGYTGLSLYIENRKQAKLYLGYHLSRVQ